MRSTWTAARGLSLALVLAVAACDVGDSAAQERAREELRDQLGEVPAVIDTITPMALSSAFRGAAQHALPAVVQIRVTARGRQGAAEIPEPFRRFFGIPENGIQAPPQQGWGSGFIVDPAGYIITNNHVIEGATIVWARLVDGREYPAEIVGRDPSSDIALLRISADGGAEFPAAELGDSEELRVGDWVLALGNPLGLDFTVTAGIVSAKGRQLPGDAPTTIQAFIQTDAAINPGNSGGPLVDLRGRVVGINTAIFGGGERFVGHGFAIPINLARRVVSDLQEHGFVRRPQLGVAVDDVDAVDAEAYGLDRVAGAEVRSVQDGSPAARAGLRAGDVILALEGVPIRDGGELVLRLAERRPGERVTLTIFRDGREREVAVELGEFDRPETVARPQAEPAGPEETLGFSVQPLTPALARELGLSSAQGVVINAVARYSPAENAGLRRGVVIRSINRQDVDSPAEVQGIARDIEPGSVVSLRIATPQGETVVNYRLPPR